MTKNFKQRWQAAYNQQAAPDNLAGGVRQFNGYRSPLTYTLLQSSLIKAAGHWRDKQVLDIGCGTGDTGSFLTAHNTLTGLDFSHQMLRYAQAIYPYITLSDAERLPFADASFDAVLAVGVWQCLPSDSPFLSEIRRVLRPGGEWVLGWVLNQDYLLYRRGVSFRLDPSVNLTLYDAASLQTQIETNGLALRRVFSVLFPFGVVGMRAVPRWVRPVAPAFTLFGHVSA